MNRTSHPLVKDFNDGANNFDRMMDEAGQPVKLTPLEQDGDSICVLDLNQPVPPGGKYTLTVEFTVTNMVQPAGQPDVFEFHFQDHPNFASGFQAETRSVEEYRLPPGAVVLEKHPAELQESTDAGQIALIIDRKIPANALRETRFRYRLASAKN
jgi:hypothetical protein